ncbi:MAG: DNA polymerase III subunit delta [Hyphomicrobiales bacterium]|nr:DNA polymerase III subunit delta [Hyphomicrobiales bacterium]
MPLIRSTDPQEIVKSAGSKMAVFLVFGSDSGQAADIAKQLAELRSRRSDPPGDIIRLTEEDLKQTPGRLASEARSLAMFGGPPVIAVKMGPQITPALMQDLLEDGALAASIIIEAGNLKKDAKIRQLFEKARNAAAIACYGASSRDLEQLVRGEVQKAGAAIAADALQRLVQLLSGDWSVCRSEVAKLLIYADGEPEITVQHVEAVVGDASAQAFDLAISATLAGNAPAALRQLDGLAASATPASVFLTMLLGHLQKLHLILAGMDRGESFDAAAAKLRPPLHFRQKDSMKEQAARWRLPHIATMIDRAHETIRQTRLKPALEHELVSDFVLRLADWRKRAA